MRRRLVTALSLVAIGLLVVTLVGPASSATRRADLAVSDLAEPPDFGVAGSSFRESVTLANQGNRTARKKTTTSFFLDLNPNNSGGRRRIGRTSFASLFGNGEESKRVRLRIPAGLASGNYFLVACADTGKKLKEAKEANNCRVSGQTIGVGLSDIGPQGPSGPGNEAVIDRFTLPIGRATIPGFYHDSDAPSGRGLEFGFEGDDEKSNSRREIAKVGPVSIVADCKRTTNGDGDAVSGPPDDPPISEDPNNFDQNGDEAKILVYTDTGSVTFNGPGQSSRPNIPPGEGTSEESDPETGATQAEANDGGEGAHQAIATARDPDQAEPEQDWAFAYKVGTVFINHSGGTQLIFTGYAGIDVFDVGDNCVFGGVLKVVKLA